MKQTAPLIGIRSYSYSLLACQVFEKLNFAFKYGYIASGTHKFAQETPLLSVSVKVPFIRVLSF